MPTLDEWEQALATPRRVQVESSPLLLKQVQQRHAIKDAKRKQSKTPIPARKDNITVVATFDPAREIRIVPAYMLHRMGVVTTPQIENLADICSTWAYFRYLWAFDIPVPGSIRPPLRLSEAAQKIDFHQKGLLSDQIGVGMAAFLLGAYLDAPLSVDVDVAVSDPTWPVSLQYKTEPDYIFFSADQSNMFVVECKGTQSARSSALEQLRRGTEQVPSLVFADGRRPPSLISATCLSRKGTRVLLIDPPGDEGPDNRTEGPESVDRRERKIHDDPEFGRVIRLLSNAKVLTFAGAGQAAASMLERAHTRSAWTPRTTPREPEILENEFGRFRGIRQRVGLRDRFNLDIFQAVDTKVYDALVSEEPARTQEELRNYQTRTAIAAGAGQGLPQNVLTSRERGAVVVRSAGPDGSLLEIRVTPT